VQQYILEYESTLSPPVSGQEDQKSGTAAYAAPVQQKDVAVAQMADEKPEGSEKTQAVRSVPQQVYQTPPTASAGAASAPAVQTPQFVVHITSSRSEETARSEWQRLSQDLPSTLGELTPYIHRTEIPVLGTYYRLKVGPFENKPSAQQLCRRLTAEKQYCQVMRLEND
jgi:cell division septation protein DedD